jgi:hypothetical protein
VRSSINPNTHMFIVLEERNAFLWGTTRSLGRGKNLAIYTERISL